MATQALRDLFVDEVKDMYDAEQRLTRSLPRLAQAAQSPRLLAAFEEHLKQTEGHIHRLERVLAGLDERVERKTCKAMVGLILEGDDLMEVEGEPAVRDAALIAAAQKVEHYEMATYGCLRTWANLLSEDEAARLLQETLDEEGAADRMLTEIARTLALDSGYEAEDELERKLDFERANEMEAESPSDARNQVDAGRVAAKSRKQ